MSGSFATTGRHSDATSASGVNSIIQNFNTVKIPGVRIKHLQALYEAKCKDLQIKASKDQERRFFEFCKKTIVDRKIQMREQGLGEASAAVLG